MDNLYKFADHLLEEADRLAAMALHSKSPHHFHEVVKLCDTAHGICEVLEVWESMDDEHDSVFGKSDNPMYGDNPRKRRRR